MSLRMYPSSEGAAVESVLFGIVALACPVGMGVMMWLMAKGRRHGGNGADAAPSLEDLRDEHRRLGAEIDRLENDSGRSRLAEAGRD
jgi:hypothetical protein